MVNPRKVFDLIPVRSVISWTSIIIGWGQSGRHSNEVIELYCRMIQDQVLPNNSFHIFQSFQAEIFLMDTLRIEDAGIVLNAVTFSSLLSGAAST